ncbi:putative WD repeat-containing protein alr3466 [Nostoc sp, PCC 7120] [Rhizoctonia solani]|uniref:Putative WD repeat-containing protein alr3466 [Nostoc sp, PCC 7120] n=1 Tax=Rhizoctonia solani TaxID=456999 RepID=A0A0K6FV39_9AGAM|nr:putative WD repeat-containing protein alr3466 [Nostoc sp, PCC 7120] [Rhizoctonia solani]
MESHKRSNQPLEREEGNVERVKHTIKALFRGEGNTGTGASSNTFPVEDIFCNGPSNSGPETERDTRQPITNSTTESNQPDLVNRPQSPQSTRVDATSTRRRGLKNLLKTGVLGPVTGALGPIKQVAEIFVDCVDTYKVAEKIKVEHDELVARLEGLFEDVMGYFDDGCSQSMTTSMKRLCKSIQEELESIKVTNQKSTTSRYLSANDKEDGILACLRRVEGYLERLSLNADLSMWKIVYEQANNYQSDRIFSLIDRLPSVLSATYNSAEGEVLQRGACTPSTRVREIATLLGWVRNKGEGSVYWLNGMAGTGKTTIAYSVCAELDSAHMLGASFFCSRLREECRNVNKIIPSIAYQLARFSRPFQYALCGALEKDPDAHGKVLQMQFDALIKDPILQVQHTLPEELTVVIDALDECEDKDSTSRMLQLLLNRSMNLPIRFVLSSRPEPEIRDQMTEQVRARLVLHELNKGEVRVDIKTYLRAALAKMEPSEEQLAGLAEKAGVLFIYAATAVRYIGYDNFQCDPEDRLRTILVGSESQEDGENEKIDRLYTTVLQAALGNQRLRKVERDNMRQVLHTVICARDPLTVSGLSELLQIHNPNRVRAALRPLWSVLHIIGDSELVTTLHASFPDFMLNPSRSKEYSCDSDSHNHTLVEHCFSRIKRAKPSFNICGLQSAYLPDRLVPDIKQRVVTTISSDLFYACRYWADHFAAGKYTATLVAQLQDFISTRLLLWMEVLNLRKQMAAGTACMKLTIDRCGQSEVKDQLMDLLHDAQRFVDTFASNPVSQSTPHIYVSMLAFWPKATPIAEHYAHFTHGPVSAEGTALDQQQLARLATWSFDQPVNDIATSPDGRHIALAVDRNVLVVDASSGQVILGPLPGHSKAVRSVMFSPDQSHIISGSWSNRSMGAVIVGWDICTGDIVLGPLQLDGNTGHMDFLLFSPECNRILTGSSEGLRMWDAENGKMLCFLKSEAHADYAAFSLDGTRVAAKLWAPGYSTLQIWSIQNGDTTLGPLSINGHGRVIFSPDNSHIASVEGPVVCVRDAQRGDIVHQLHHAYGHDSRFIKYAPDGSHIVSFNYDQTIVVWNVHTGEIVLGPLEGHAAQLQSIAFSPDGSYFISAYYDGRVCKWNARQYSSTPHSITERSHEILSFKFSPDGKRFASGFADGTVSVWDAYTGEILVGPIEQHRDEVRAVDFSNDHIASVSKDGTMFVFDALTGEVVLGPIEVASERNATAIAYSPCESLIAIASAHSGYSKPDGVDLWDAQTGARVLSLSKIPGDSYFAVYSIQFSPDGTRILGSGFMGNWRIVIWDALTGEPVLEFHDGPTGNAFPVSYSPNGALVASGSTAPILWDAYTGTKKLGPLTGHTDWVNSVSFSADNSYLVSGSDDKTIRIWDVQTGEMVFELPHGHEQDIKSVAYSPDGTHIISHSRDMSVRVHDARSTEERAALNSTTEYGDWTMNQDGWVIDDQPRLLVWIPGDLRRTLMWPRTQFRLLVTPVIAWAASSEFVHELRPNEREGDEIWGHPLEAMLSPELLRQSGVLSRPLAKKNTEEWPYESDIYEANGCGEPTAGSVLSQYQSKV